MELEEARICLPVKDNQVLSGVPLHFSGVDLKEMRKNLLKCAPLTEYFHLESDDVVFFVCAKVSALPAGVGSTWLFFGAEMPLPEKTVMELINESQRAHLDEIKGNEEAVQDDEENFDLTAKQQAETFEKDAKKK